MNSGVRFGAWVLLGALAYLLCLAVLPPAAELFDQWVAVWLGFG